MIREVRIWFCTKYTLNGQKATRISFPSSNTWTGTRAPKGCRKVSLRHKRIPASAFPPFQYFFLQTTRRTISSVSLAAPFSLLLRFLCFGAVKGGQAPSKWSAGTSKLRETSARLALNSFLHSSELSINHGNWPNINNYRACTKVHRRNLHEEVSIHLAPIAQPNQNLLRLWEFRAIPWFRLQIHSEKTQLQPQSNWWGTASPWA